MLLNLTFVKASQSAYDALLCLVANTFDIRLKVIVSSDSGASFILQGLGARSLVGMSFESLDCLVF